MGILRTKAKELLLSRVTDDLALWKRLSPTHRLGSGLQLEISHPTEWIIYNDIFVDGEYDAAIEMALEHGGDEPLVIDLGANVGFFGMRFADAWFRKSGDFGFKIVGVEASPRVYADLKRRMGLPPLSDSCEYHLGLVGKRSGVGSLAEAESHFSNSILHEPHDFTNRSSVPFVDVCSLLPPGKPVALLKCDIEGAEELFLENYSDLLERVESMVIELHRDLCDADRCADLIRQSGLVHHTRAREHGSYVVDIFRRQGQGVDFQAS